MTPVQERTWRGTKCRCCLHSQKRDGWPKTWCAGLCVHLRFPQHLRDEYELLQRCIDWEMRTMSAGMGATSMIEPKFDSAEFRLQMEMGEIPRRFWEEIRESMRELFGLWYSFRDGKHGYGEKDYDETVRLTDESVVMVEVEE